MGIEGSLKEERIVPKRFSFRVAMEVAIYRMGSGAGAKIPGKWERKWKMVPGDGRILELLHN